MRAQLADALARYGRLVYSNSLGAEAMVLTDIIWTHFPAIDIFSIDTGRLHEETYDAPGERCSAATSAACGSCTRMPRALEQPGRAARASTVSTTAWRRAWSAAASARSSRSGARSPATRRWITGVRREQSSGRAHGQPEEWDARVRTLQAQPAPRLERGRGVALHPRARGCRTMRCTTASYPSIGCSPCTRAIQPGESRRAGPLVVGAARIARMRPASKTSRRGRRPPA